MTLLLRFQNNMQNFLGRMHQYLSRIFGINLRRFFNGIRYLPGYCFDYFSFKRLYVGKIAFNPCVHDKFEQSGAVDDEYFWQDLLVAQIINSQNPTKHVDIGSRIGGFVAHIASTREIEVFDIRPLQRNIPNVVFTQADMTIPDRRLVDYCDSISCLHALEHFGLGRYGDRLSAFGYEVALKNMVNYLKTGGHLYLSLPIGIERVEFNSHRVFHPLTIIECAENLHLKLVKSIIVRNNGQHQIHHSNDILHQRYHEMQYNLAIFVFTKQND